MKKVRLFLPLLLLLATTPMTGQIEHAATREQCRADAAAWSIPSWSPLIQHEDQFFTLAGQIVHDHSLNAKMLDDRSAEFQVCMKTDSAQSGRYALARFAYGFGEMARMADYMHRHNQIPQFYQEENSGQR